jgi:hypothetical protein
VGDLHALPSTEERRTSGFRDGRPLHTLPYLTLTLHIQIDSIVNLSLFSIPLYRRRKPNDMPISVAHVTGNNDWQALAPAPAPASAHCCSVKLGLEHLQPTLAACAHCSIFPCLRHTYVSTTPSPLIVPTRSEVQPSSIVALLLFDIGLVCIDR